MRRSSSSTGLCWDPRQGAGSERGQPWGRADSTAAQVLGGGGKELGPLGCQRENRVPQASLMRLESSRGPLLKYTGSIQNVTSISLSD